MKKRYRKGKRMAAAWGLIFMGVAVLAVLFDGKIYPIVQEFSAAKAKSHAGECINQAVGELLADLGVAYDDLIRTTADTNGQIRSVTADAMAIDRLKTEAVQRIRRKVDDQEMTVEIPVGNLTGSAYLAGRGPGIPVKLKLSTNVTARITGDFLDAGINQTLHLLKLEITADVFILLPTGRTTVPCTAEYLLGQTVIVGDVPDAYTNVLTGEDDIEGLIEDFGADVTE